MKRLNILKPDVRTGYLDFGRGQEVTYLSVPEDITNADLEADIDNGAVQYKEVLNIIKKKPSRFVIVNCNSEEEGLTAVSYLSAIYNKIEGVDQADNSGFEEEMSDERDIDFEDFEEEPIGFDSCDDEGTWEEDSAWKENPWRIPVIQSSQMLTGDDSGFSTFGNGGISYGRAYNPKNRLPYWYYTRHENLCIVHNMLCGALNNPFSNVSFSQRLKRYKNNRHVFLVVVTDRRMLMDLYNTETFIHPDKNTLCEIILEYSAATLMIGCKEDELNRYHINLFENWIDRYSYTLSKNFPVKKIVNNIVGMDNQNKSDLLEKVIKYVIKEDDGPRELKEEDFAILSQFKSLGADLTKGEHTNLKKIQENLVGMDSVKEQIKGIVEVMRYNKRRANMGLDTGNFHNVHMMLGAPGTAKTTVAELLGNIMAEEHLLPGNKFISVNGAELKGMYVGHSAPKVKALFDEYDTIFIDEAYAVAAGTDGDSDSFSQEAIAQLIVELENHGMDRLVMFAGYGGANVSEKDNKMKKFLQSNPGIRSRINSTIYFDSYTADEMLEIFKCHARLGQFNVSKKADPIIKEFFKERVERNDFGNGREARSLLENSMVEAAKRLANVDETSLTEKMLKEITYEDVKRAIDHMRLGTTMQFGKKTGFGFNY